MGDLDRYRSKRSFDDTPEPQGGRSKKGKPRFVIQKHDATSLHYDFRLEVDGVLASWAVPKGPSTDPRDKRLAMRTEDHPLDYYDFEGNIPEGNYGAGSVIVWDAGTFENRTKEKGEDVALADAIARGHVSVWLEGKKIEGGYSLRRMRGGEKEQWLLVKKRDEAADARRNPVSSQPESVISGKTNEGIANED